MTYLHNEIVSVRLQKQSLNSIDPMLRMKRELRRAHEKYFIAQFLSDSSLVKMVTSIIRQSTEKHPLVRPEFHEQLEQIHDSKIPSLVSCLFKKMKSNDFFLPKKVEKKALLPKIVWDRQKGISKWLIVFMADAILVDSFCLVM